MTSPANSIPCRMAFLAGWISGGNGYKDNFSCPAGPAGRFDYDFGIPARVARGFSQRRKYALAVRNSLEPLARNCPDVDEVIGLPASDSAVPSQQDEWRRTISAWFAACWKSKFGGGDLIWRLSRAATLTTTARPRSPIFLAHAANWFQRASEPGTRQGRNAGFDLLLTESISGNCEGHEILSLVRLREKLGKRGPVGLVPGLRCRKHAWLRKKYLRRPG